MTKLLIDGPTNAKATLILAHGAGAAMDTDFMTAFAESVAENNIKVIRFNFNYMEIMQETGRRRPPDRAPKLLERFDSVIKEHKCDNLFIGGKSMGGRMASMIAAGHGNSQTKVSGCICLGYPFHAPGKPEKIRIDHFADLKAPVLICQGERDPFGTKAEIASYDLPEGVEFHWLNDGEHSFKPRKASGTTLEENIASAARATAGFIKAQSA